MPNQAETEGVLVLDGDMIPALTIARSLGRQGVDVVVGAHQRAPLAGFSRHVLRTLTYPNPLTEEADFLAWCEKTIKEKRYRLIIPVTERTVVPMQRVVGMDGGERLAIAPPAALDVALDKNQTLLKASELGIPIPQSVLIESQAQFSSSPPSIRFPLVIKPSHSIGANQSHRKQLSVEYAFNQRELEDKLNHFLQYGPVLLQEYVAGVGAGIEVICDDGKIAYAFQHQRVHEMPLTGGGSSLRMSVELNPELLAASRKLMQALKWHGVAMVEFKWNPDDGTFALMEINGRFWGSLPLAVAAGADFPAMLYELATQGRMTERAPAKPGIYCRKLSSDIDWHELVLRREGPAEIVEFPSKRVLLADLLKIFSFSHSFDVQQWRDPLPGLVDISRIARSQFSRLYRLVQEKRAKQIHRKKWRDGTVSKGLQGATQILFICYGNINRSSLAERYMQSLTPATGLRVLSAGFHQEDGRPADPTMVKVAAKRNLDLSDWSSRRIDAEMVKASDLVFVMELRQYDRMCDEYPGSREKCFLLGMADAKATASGEIDDPYGKDYGFYERCLNQVCRCVDRLSESVPRVSR